jgi:cytochrome c biogenesis protein CcmG/thiol:disulfide interchange protein DsbE
VPETFIIDKAGRIAYKHIGPIAQKDWEETLQPLIEELSSQDL